MRLVVRWSLRLFVETSEHFASGEMGNLELTGTRIRRWSQTHSEYDEAALIRAAQAETRVPSNVSQVYDQNVCGWQ